MDQALYNSCVDPYNQGFRSKPGFRSMVTGSGYGSTSCFWVWGKATQQQADDQAFVNCRKEKGLCNLFATTNGMTKWFDEYRITAVETWEETIGATMSASVQDHPSLRRRPLIPRILRQQINHQSHPRP